MRETHKESFCFCFNKYQGVKLCYGYQRERGEDEKEEEDVRSRKRELFKERRRDEKSRDNNSVIREPISMEENEPITIKSNKQ